MYYKVIQCKYIIKLLHFITIITSDDDYDYDNDDDYDDVYDDDYICGMTE